eukprot:5036722-Amphidinium_carterae.1
MGTPCYQGLRSWRMQLHKPTQRLEVFKMNSSALANCTMFRQPQELQTRSKDREGINPLL